MNDKGENEGPNDWADGSKNCEEGHVRIQEIRLLSATMLKIGIHTILLYLLFSDN